MSSEGTGVILIPLAAAAALTIGAVYVVGRGTYALAKLAYDEHKKAEENRLHDAEVEFKAVQGELGKIALTQHQHLTEISKDMLDQHEKTLTQMEADYKANLDKLENAGRDFDTAIQILPKFFEREQQKITKIVNAELTDFSDKLNEKYGELSAQTNKSMVDKKIQTMADLDNAANTLQERNQNYRDYAETAMISIKSMLTALDQTYVCETFVSTELSSLRMTLAQISNLLRSENNAAPRMAAMNAAEAESRVLALQVLVEQRTAEFNHQKAVLESTASRLREIVEASHSFKLDGVPPLTDDMDRFINLNKDPNYWSAGKLEQLWKQAEVQMTKSDNYTWRNDRGETAEILLGEMNHTIMDLEKEYAKAISFVVSQISMEKLAADYIDVMYDEGWDLSEDPAYQQDPRTGRRDMRQPFHMIFEHPNGDLRGVTLYSEWDETRGSYMIHQKRYMCEMGAVNQHDRNKLDQLIDQKMQKKGYENFSTQCTLSTMGQKANI